MANFAKESIRHKFSWEIFHSRGNPKFHPKIAESVICEPSARFQRCNVIFLINRSLNSTANGSERRAINQRWPRIKRLRGRRGILGPVFPMSGGPVENAAIDLVDFTRLSRDPLVFETAAFKGS